MMNEEYRTWSSNFCFRFKNKVEAFYRDNWTWTWLFLFFFFRKEETNKNIQTLGMKEITHKIISKWFQIPKPMCALTPEPGLFLHCTAITPSLSLSETLSIFCKRREKKEEEEKRNINIKEEAPPYSTINRNGIENETQYQRNSLFFRLIENTERGRARIVSPSIHLWFSPPKTKTKTPPRFSIL